MPENGSIRLRVPFTGELDMATAPAFERALARAVSVTSADVWVDLGGCTFMDSAGVHCLLRAQERLKRSGRRLFVTCDGAVLRTLEITGLERLLDPGDGAAIGPPAA